jgi:hypothetical protein
VREELQEFRSSGVQESEELQPAYGSCPVGRTFARQRSEIENEKEDEDEDDLQALVRNGRSLN